MFQIILKELREREKLSQAKLAKMIGVAQSTVGMWENGKNKPEYETLLKISELFDVSTDYITGNSDSNASHRKKGIKIPVLGKVQAGIPIEAIEDILDYEEITEELAATGNFFALQISGDSMEPRFNEGDVVIVQLQEYVDNGAVAVVLVNGCDATIKKVYFHETGMSLVATNPVYPPLFYSGEEVESLPVRVLGKVVELRVKF